MANVPLFVRKFFVDFVETALGFLLGLTLVFPNSMVEAKQVAVVIAVGVLGAFVSALRRATPDAIGWLKGKLGVGG